MKTLSAGIDVGSSAVKVAVVESEHGSGRDRAGARVLATAIERIRRRDPLQVASLTYADTLKRAGVSAVTEFKALDINTLIHESLSLLEHQLHQNHIRVEPEYDRALPRVYGNGGKL